MLGSFTSVVRPCTFSKAIAPLIRSKPAAQLQQVRFATKKAAGSSNNNRDSAGRRLGIKVWPGTQAKPGAIIIRQRGKKFYAGENVGMGKDHTIFSKINGEVYFTRNHKKSNVVHVRASA